ncbi:hypothetical protein OH77DRAFT_868650 [Trametes cingulata]|nr:hypothetical protein OH77DRAFT_868650 [Trametes cingulata]
MQAACRVPRLELRGRDSWRRVHFGCWRASDGWRHPRAEPSASEGFILPLRPSSQGHTRQGRAGVHCGAGADSGRGCLLQGCGQHVDAVSTPSRAALLCLMRRGPRVAPRQKRPGRALRDLGAVWISEACV